MQADVEETRHEIHELIERHPAPRSFLAVPPDDEPLTEEAEAVIRASEESIARGELLIPHEEILKEYGL